jgi:hypothetical protein
MHYIPFYDQDEDEDPREYDQYNDPEHGYNRPPTWPALESFDGPDFDDEVPF